LLASWVHWWELWLKGLLAALSLTPWAIGMPGLRPADFQARVHSLWLGYRQFIHRGCCREICISLASRVREAA